MRATEGRETLAREDSARRRDEFRVVKGERRGSTRKTRDGKRMSKQVKGGLGNLWMLKTFL